MFIILTAAEADALRGPTGPGAALDPRALADGTFALPLAVLSDPVHAKWHAVLPGLPQRDVAAEEWLVASDSG